MQYPDEVLIDHRLGRIGSFAATDLVQHDAALGKGGALRTGPRPAGQPLRQRLDGDRQR